MRIKDRVIGRFTGHKKGPLLIAIGAMHGNEFAGIKAIEIVLKMLEVEPLANPGFTFTGKFIGLVGNKEALLRNKRYVKRDLNRMWDEDNVSRIMSRPLSTLEAEKKELFLLLETIKQEIRSYNPEQVYILDLHTTTAGGGIFSLPTESKKSLKIAQELHAPVILGFLENIKGTTLHYFNTENLGIETTITTFEAGQHYDKLSVHRAVSAIVNYMRSIGCVHHSDVESHHDDLLAEYACGLPKIAKLIYGHPVKPSDKFIMEEGYNNFQAVKKGEVLAHDREGEIKSPTDGLILMPLYQSQGEDGFFLVEEIKELNLKVYNMIWKISEIEEIETGILEREEGSIDFIEKLTETQSAIAAWLTDEEHNMLSGNEFVIFVYLTEVIIRSSSDEWVSIVSDIDIEVLSDTEEDLWQLSNKQKRTAIEERFEESLIAQEEEHLFYFIHDTIQDAATEIEMESIVKEFLWIGSLSIAEMLYKYKDKI